MSKVISRLSLVFLSFSIAILCPLSASALNFKRLRFFGQTGISIFDPDADDCKNDTSMGNSDGSDVSLFGDSITVASLSELKSALPQIEIDAKSGTWMVQDDATFGASALSRIQSSSSLRDIVVVAMGTNGGASASDLETIISAINSDERSHQIIFTTIYVVSLASKDASEGNMMSSTNSAVNSIAAKYDYVSVADWATAVKSANPSQIIGDNHVHPSSPAGTELFAKTIQTAVNKVTKMNRVSVSSNISEITATGAERVAQATRVFGQTAMQAQKVYGVPWELLIAQMQVESNVGQGSFAQSTNNWLGIRGTGDAGSYQTSSNGNFSKWSSVDACIAAWAGSFVARNGFYDSSFQYLDPNHYDLHSFLVEFISVYAPSSDGNNVSAYVSNVETIIEKMIRPVREEMGWPSSEEYAKQNHIAIGGEFPIGSPVDDSAFSLASTCSNSTSFVGSINETALLLSWPERGHDPWNDPKPEYKAALAATGVNKLGDSCSMNGNSCDAFAATVLRYSQADADFPCCGAANALSYLSSHPEKYQEIPNIGSAENLLPGDIRSSSSHIEIYVEEDGVGKIASASHCSRTGDRGISYYPDSRFRIFRKL